MKKENIIFIVLAIIGVLAFITLLLPDKQIVGGSPVDLQVRSGVNTSSVKVDFSTSTLVVATNTARVFAKITNISSDPVCLKLGTGASTTTCPIYLAQWSSFTIDPYSIWYSGVITGRTSGAASSTVVVSEK